MRRLREYLLATALFTALGVGTLYAILRGAHLVIRQCRSWFGRFGQSKRIDPAEFARRRDDVKAAYAPLPAGEVTVCVDAKRVYHRPEKGASWQHQKVPADRPARYHKSDTRTDILGALVPREAMLDLECLPAATGATTAPFLARVVERLVAAGWQPHSSGDGQLERQHGGAEGSGAAAVVGASPGPLDPAPRFVAEPDGAVLEWLSSGGGAEQLVRDA